MNSSRSSLFSQLSSPPVRLVAYGDSLLLCLKDFLLEDCPAFLDHFARQESLPGDPLNQHPEQARVCPAKIRVGGFAGSPLNFTSNWQLYHLMVTKPKTASETTSPTRSSEAPPLVVSLTSCIRKLSSTHSRNLLDSCLSAVLCFQQMSGKLKSPTLANAHLLQGLLQSGVRKGGGRNGILQVYFELLFDIRSFKWQTV